MKVGLSFSQCIRDIVQGKVDIDEVLIIIGRTNFDATKPEHIEELYKGYAYTWEGLDRDQLLKVIEDLWHTGRIHQPRKFGSWRPSRQEVWLETVLISSDLERNTVAKELWEQFQVVAGLTNVTLDKEYN